MGSCLNTALNCGISFTYFLQQRNYLNNNSEFSCRIYAFLAKHEDAVVVGLFGGRFRDEKACCLSSKTREKNVWWGRMFVPNWLKWSRLTMEILCDVTGKWPKAPEVRKSHWGLVVWPLWDVLPQMIPRREWSQTRPQMIPNHKWFPMWRKTRNGMEFGFLNSFISFFNFCTYLLSWTKLWIRWT